MDAVVVADHDVEEGTTRRGQPLQQPVDEAARLGQLLVEQRRQTRPQRRDRAGTANDCGDSVDAHRVATYRARITRDVGHTPAGLALDRRLPGRPGEQYAEATARRCAASVIPH